MVDSHFVWGGNTILEPSAGKGDILKGFLKYSDYNPKSRDVDCIEIDPNLRRILSYNFSNERRRELNKKRSDILKEWSARDYKSSKLGYHYYDTEKRTDIALPDDVQKELENLDEELREFFDNGINIIHDDFLTYEPFKRYDLIIMNPPFSNGDKHLLKAIDIQKDGGKIVCLLNAETLRNPYTESRKKLVEILEKSNAEIEYIQNGFSSAERKTDVEVALIKINFPNRINESEIFNHMQEKESYSEFSESEVKDLTVTDFIKNITTQYRVEIKSGLALMKAYKDLVPYIGTTFKTGDSIPYPILELKMHGVNRDATVNDFVREVRYKYWETLLANPKFTSRLTSKMKEEYYRQIDRFAKYDFSEFNIKALTVEMNSRVKEGIETEAIKMFDRLTAESSYYPECANNKWLYTGWKTNKAHKIGKKVIIPCYGNVFCSNSWIRANNAYKALSDIERVLNFFDGCMTADVDLEETAREYLDKGITKNIPLKYFTATFYKKGTVHLVFNCPKLIERFNIYAGQRKGWLPPCYGYKKYKDMDKEEKAVVDEFQGENAYNEVLENSNYYLGSVTENVLMLGQ